MKSFTIEQIRKYLRQESNGITTHQAAINIIHNLTEENIMKANELTPNEASDKELTEFAAAVSLNTIRQMDEQNIADEKLLLEMGQITEEDIKIAGERLGRKAQSAFKGEKVLSLDALMAHIQAHINTASSQNRGIGRIGYFIPGSLYYDELKIIAKKILEIYNVKSE